MVKVSVTVETETTVNVEVNAEAGDALAEVIAAAVRAALGKETK